MVPRQETILAACAQEGRDPATLAVTVGVNVLFATPDAVLPKWANPESAIIGSVEQVATAFRDYEALGVAHVICNLNPHNKNALKQLSQALHIYRAMEQKN